MNYVVERDLDSVLNPKSNPDDRSVNPPNEGNTSADFLFYLGVAYLLYFAQPLSWLWHAGLSPQSVVGFAAGLGLFALVYVWLMRRVLVAGAQNRLPSLVSAAFTAVLGALACVLTLAGGIDFLGLFIYASVAAGFALPIWPALAVIGAIVVATIGTGLATAADWSSIGQIAGLDAAIGVGMVGTARLVTLNRELRAARRELARLAVAEERLRIARDLHDLLGHSLSLIAVKSELAGRLIGTERATIEVHEIEDVARAALLQVRDAVSGYRQPTLVSELDSARQMLTAAGITCQVENDWPTLPIAAEAALSWALREGVTNVIRHSHGRQCAIRIAETSDAVLLEVIDDGHGGPVPPDGSGGTGLSGVAERMAFFGGTCSAAPRAGGGFRLAVSVARGLPDGAGRP